jgi:hypothetical protein
MATTLKPTIRIQTSGEEEKPNPHALEGTKTEK